jgi:phosphatidylinositol alpha-1,6-mannosyltransferase
MNVLLTTLEYPPFKGGVANYYEAIVRNWPDNNIFVLHNNDNHLINNKLPFLKWFPGIFRLKKEIKEKKIKHIIIGNVLPLGTIAFLISKIFKINYSVVLHGTDIMYACKSKRKKILTKAILKNADKIICNSSYVKKITSDFLNKEYDSKIFIVTPGINYDFIKSLSGKHNKIKKEIIKKYNLNNKKILFSIGRLIKRKGVDKVIKVFSEILEKYPNTVYVVAGIGKDEKYLKSLAKNNKNIIFLGLISEEEKWALMDLCDIFIQPTREEDGNFDGFGIVYLEAGIFRKPVIAGNSGGVSDAVEDMNNGLLVDPYSKKEIKNAILRLLGNEKLCLELGEKGRERLKKFDWKLKSINLFNIIKNT